MKAIDIAKVSLATVLAAGFLTSQAMAGDLVIAGSTTVQKRVLEPAADAIAKATGIKVTVKGVGSGGGFKELMAGNVPASAASSPMASLLSKNNLQDDGTYVENVIIKDVIVAIVNAKNPVKSLTWEQLAKLNTGEVTNWKDVGGPDCEVKVVTSHPGSATRSVFQKKVMKKKDYAKGAKEVKSTRQEVGRVAKSKCAIGAVSASFVALDEKNKGKVTVIESDPIERPLSLITKGAATGDVAKLLEFLATPEAQKHFQ